ncbi:MAG: PKD domain-containing protein, partial [Microthrixaceae bacterium]
MMRHRMAAAIGVAATLVLVAVACVAPPTPAPENVTPVGVIIAEPQAGVAPLEVQFSGLDSTDPDGTITGYVWSFGDGGTSTDPTPTHTYVNPGTYNARLIVTDNAEASSSPVTVTIEVTFDFDPIVLVDDDAGTDDSTCGTRTAPCASITHGISRAQADAKDQVWAAEGEYSAFTVVEGIDVRGGYAADFLGTAGASVVQGAYDASNDVSAAIVAVDVDDTTVEGFTAIGADESANGRTALAAYVGGAGSGLALDNLTLTGGQHGAAATALLVDGAVSVSLSAPTVTAGNAVGAGNSSYGIRAIDGATVTVDGGTIVAGYGANG